MVVEVVSAHNINEAIQRERAYQDRKWGSIEVHPHEVMAWLTLIRRYLTKAEEGWCDSRGDVEALQRILQVAALCTACLEQHAPGQPRIPAFPFQARPEVGSWLTIFTQKVRVSERLAIDGDQTGAIMQIDLLRSSCCICISQHGLYERTASLTT